MCVCQDGVGGGEENESQQIKIFKRPNQLTAMYGPYLDPDSKSCLK